MIISKTPVRISFFGGGTDYREYFERHRGAVLGTTIDKYVYVSVNSVSDFFDYKIRVAYSRSEFVNRVEDIVHPSVRETLKYKKIDRHLDIHIFSDLPVRTGLGSSSAFTVGFLNALYTLEGKVVHKQRLAEEAVYIEHEMTGERGGYQDQFHAAFGGLNIIEFQKTGIAVRPVIIAREKLDILQDSLLIFYTGLTRNSGEILKEQLDNTRSGDKDVYLGKMAELVYTAEKTISDKGPDEMVAGLGGLLHKGWELKKSLSTKVSNDIIDRIYERALKAGAYGGKISGAGSGGFMSLIVKKERQEAVRESLRDLLELKFRFEDEGSKIIYLK
jgi:D-glycero-alpha-D-manno-heptose-7-phosphate kinase